MILHQNYKNTVPCDVLGMSETRLTATGIRFINESLEEINLVFVSGERQPQRRPDADGRYFDAVHGGVGLLTKSHIPYTRTPLIAAEYTEEETRRALAVTLFPGQGLESIRVYQIYGFARARDDHERMMLNESFLGKNFQDANANGGLPVVVMGDFKTDPLSSATTTHEVNSGNWCDALASTAVLEERDPHYTFEQKGVKSRIDLCLLNGSAMQLFQKFEKWDHKYCTIPNHRMQCLTLKLEFKKQYEWKPDFSISSTRVERVDRRRHVLS